MVAPGQRGQQNEGRGEQRVTTRQSLRSGQRLRGRLHALAEPTVVELGDRAVLRSSAFQVAILGFVLPHRVGHDVSAKEITEKKTRETVYDDGRIIL